jgi:hypothetical protein
VSVRPTRVCRKFTDVNAGVLFSEDYHPGRKTQGGTQRVPNIYSVVRSVEGNTCEAALYKRRFALNVAVELALGPWCVFGSQVVFGISVGDRWCQSVSFS